MVLLLYRNGKLVSFIKSENDNLLEVWAHCNNFWSSVNPTLKGICVFKTVSSFSYDPEWKDFLLKTLVIYQNWMGMADIISEKCWVTFKDCLCKTVWSSLNSVSVPWNDFILNRMQFIRNSGWWGNVHSVIAIEAVESSQNIS